MRNVLITVSLILFSSAYSQNFQYESICHNESFIITNLDINKNGVKDRVACNIV